MSPYSTGEWRLVEEDEDMPDILADGDASIVAVQKGHVFRSVTGFGPRRVPAPIASEVRQRLGEVALETELQQSGHWDVSCEWYPGVPRRMRRIARAHGELVRAVYDLGDLEDSQRARMDAVIDLVSKGVTESVAAKAIGMTFLQHRTLKDTSPYYRLSLRIAIAVAESDLVGVVSTAALNGDVKSAQWMLERRFSDRWSKQETKNVKGTVKHDHTHRGIREMPREKLIEHARDILEAEVVKNVHTLPDPDKTSSDD